MNIKPNLFHLKIYTDVRQFGAGPKSKYIRTDVNVGSDVFFAENIYTQFSLNI